MLVSAPLLRVPGEGDPQRAEGRVYLFSAQGGLGPRPDWTMTGAPDFGLGYSVAAVGDVTGDGFDDVLLGAPDTDGGFAYEGAAFVFAGSASGLGPAAVWGVFGGATSDWLGVSVASAGDVDADGFLDVVVGSATEAHVFLGGPGGLPATPSAVLPIGPHGSFESDVEHADVNGDGFDDVLAIGSQEILVFAGSPSGPAIVPASRRWRFGYAWNILGRAGDVNGDGFEDFLAGEYSSGDVQFRCILGSGTWATMATAGGYGCQSVAEAEPLGDVDGDGYDDILFAGDRSEPEVIYHGSPTGLFGPAVGAAFFFLGPDFEDPTPDLQRR